MKIFALLYKKILTFIKLGVAKQKAWEWANTRKSYWHIANSWILTTTLTNARFEKQGYLSFIKYYLEVRV
jgi:hypothetical protein